MPTPAIAPDPARAHRVDERSGDRHPETEHGEVRAHDQREGAAADVVGRAALDEQGVADERGRVPDPADDDEQRRDPDVRARCPRRCSRPPSSRSRARRAASSRAARASVDANSAPITAPRPFAAQSRPKPKSPASNETFASTTSETLTNAIVIIARFQERSTVEQRARMQDEPEALAEVLPVPAALGAALLEQRGRDLEQQHGRDAEADRVDHVGRIRARQRRRLHRRAASRP